MIYKLCINNAMVESYVFLTREDAIIIAGFDRVMSSGNGDRIKLSETMELVAVGVDKWYN